MSTPSFTDVDALKEFMFAGKAKLTLESIKSGNHYTYKVRRAPDNDTLWFVHRLTSVSISSQRYVYLGTIYPDDRGFQATRRTPNVWKNEPSFLAFFWFYSRMIEANRIPKTVKVYHEGKCGMCGRELTDPASIAEGFGPECSKKRLRRGMMNDRKTT